MPYIGQNLQVAYPTYKNIDDISGSFNGSTTSFALLVSGAAPVPLPLNSQQCLISVGGVIQRPDDTGSEGFRLSGGNIVFSSAPSTGEDFFGIILAGADYVNVGANFPDGSVGVPSITFEQDSDTGFYRSGSGVVSFSSNSVQTAILGSNSLTAPSFIPTSSTVPTNGVYLPAANSVGISTNSTERLRINSSGNVGIGTSSPSSLLHLSVATAASDGTKGVRITNPAGTAAMFECGSSNDSYVGTTSGSDFSIRTNNTSRIYVTNGGNVGIGTTSPGTTLDVNGGAQVTGSASGYNGGEIRLGATTADLNHAVSTQSTGTPTMLFDHRGTGNTGQFAWRVGTGGASERMRIDSSGRLLVGTSTTSSPARLLAQGSVGANYSVFDMAFNGTPSSGNALGYFRFTDGSNNSYAEIRCDADAATGTNDYPGRLVFSTTADGASSPTEHMRITETGVFKCSTDGTYAAPTGTAYEIRQHRSDDGLQIYATSGGFVNNVFLARASRNTTNNTFYGISYYNDGAGAYRFRVADSGNCTNTNNSYTGISDIKLKENVVDANSQWQDIKSLQVRNYNFKEETGQPTHRQIGLIAQEVETVCPHLVDESPDRDGDGNDLGTTTKSVQYSVLYMKAVKALQEAIERIEQLEAKVAALESA